MGGQGCVGDRRLEGGGGVFSSIARLYICVVCISPQKSGLERSTVYVC